jgi:Super-infection exclusion protein B
MSGELAALAQTILEWIKAPWKLLVVLFLICSFALFSPKSWMQAMGIKVWVDAHWPLLVGLFAFAGIFSMITVAEEVVTKLIIQKRKDKRLADAKRKKLESVLRSVASDEINVLSQYSGGHSTLPFTREEGVVHNLVKKGILQCVNERDFISSYSLTDQVMEYLEENHFPSISAAISKLREKLPS